MAKVRFFEDPEFFRKQTFVIMGAMVCALSMLYVPLYVLQSKVGGLNVSKVFNVVGTVTAKNISGISEGIDATNVWTTSSYLMCLFLAGGCFASLFLYKNRKLQSTVARVLALDFAAVPALSYLAGKEFVASVPNLGIQISYGWGLVFSLLGLGLAFYASYLINEDERKIKAASRLW